MVNNINKILDEGVIKIIMAREYKMVPKYITKFEWIIADKKYDIFSLQQRKDSMIDLGVRGVTGQSIRQGYTRRMYDEACEEYDKLIEDEFIQKWIFQCDFNYGKIPKYFWKDKSICDYMGVVPFSPSVMINISPNWSVAVDKMSNSTKAKRLESVINDYMKIDNRYDYYSYVVECGSAGDHIHAHIVAHVNPKLVKSVCGGKNSHIGKGSRLPGALNTQGGKRGMKGVFSGKGISTTILNCEELVMDKLDYLTEEKKPDGHKNKFLITGRVDVVLFTVK